tara:strand:+ start:11447 stop:12754 length:1308 start_codon:yes stop_codon:yes gene_type:complete
MKILKKKIKDNKVNIGIIGLGYVGLPLALNFAKKKIKVYGFDIDKSKVQLLKSKKSYLNHVKKHDLKVALKNRFEPTNNFKYIKNLDVILICVPTPLKQNYIPDLSFINKTMKSITPFIKENQLICLESTTYPGTTRDLILPKILKKGFKVGDNFFLAFSPERLDPAMKMSLIKSIPKVVGGMTESCTEITTQIYRKVYKKIIKMSDIESAETTKLLENIFRAVNIGLINEFKQFTDKLNINLHEIIKAASTKPFGFLPFYPGPGLGGHCIPIDPFYLTWKANKIGVDTKFIKLAGKINSSIPHKIVKKIKKISEQKKNLKLKVLILGLAYKKNINDLRESPGMKILDLLKKNDFNVHYNDPHINEIPKLRDYKIRMKSVVLNSKNLRYFDLVVLVTDHDAYDYDFIHNHSKIIIDTRSVYSKKYTKVISDFYNL